MGNHNKLLQFLRQAAADKPPSSTTSDCDSDGDASSYSPPPFAMSPWTQLPGLGGDAQSGRRATGLLDTLVKEEGHVYSLAASGDLLYTGTDSRNVRVWRDRRDLGGFRAGSGLVKAVVVATDGRIFTGHQDGKVRVWRRHHKAKPAEGGLVRHRRVGALPRARDALLRRARHADAVSCLSLDPAAGLLYSGSWDRTVKVWRVADSRCLETLPAHADAVNAVAAAGFDALLLTGSADGTVKVWRRRSEDEDHRTRTRHVVERVLRAGDAAAVTSIAVSVDARVVYAGTSDGAVAHWQFPRPGSDGRTRTSGAALRGHGKMAVLCLAAAGRVVVSGSADRTLCVWRREGGAAHHARLAVLRGHAGPVKCVAVDQEEEVEDGGHRRRAVVVYSGSLDGSVKVWRVEEEEDDAVMTTPSPLLDPVRRSRSARPACVVNGK
jgi:WD40 repeat protein